MKDLRTKPFGFGKGCALTTTLLLTCTICNHASAQEASSELPLPAPVQEDETTTLPEYAVAQPREGEVPLQGGDWVVEIRPKGSGVNVKSYNKIYNQIPYRRSEYLANPSYRHDTAVEIMFGKMRNTVVHRQQTPKIIENPRPETFAPDRFREMDFRQKGLDRRRYLQYGLLNFRWLFPGLAPLN